MKRAALIALLMVWSGSLFTQTNLVVNGGFEAFQSCPTALAQSALAGWAIPINHLGTSDFYNGCSAAPGATVPNNIIGNNVTAHTGVGMGGLIQHEDPNLREYLTDTLVAPLEAGKEYVVRFWYRSGENSELASDDLGVLLTNSMPIALSSQVFGWLGVPPTLANPTGNYLSNYTWNQFVDTLIATGGEQFITIGAFDSSGIGHVITVSPSAIFSLAYLYIDDIEVFQVNSQYAENHCFGEDFQFSIDTSGLDSAKWNFGDPNSGALNTSELFLPKHLFSDTGTFSIQLITYAGGVADTFLQDIKVYPRQTIDLGLDIHTCGLDPVTFDISQPYSSYLWNDGSTVDSATVSTDTTLFATVFGVCDTVSDTVRLRFDNPLSVYIGEDTSICENDSVQLNGVVSGEAVLLWSTADSGNTLVVYDKGEYVLFATNACGTFYDTVQVGVLPLPADSGLLPNDTVNCFDNRIVLIRPQNDSLTFMWSDSTTAKSFEVDTTMSVWLAAFNECGFASDTMRIVFNGEIKTELGEDTTICDEDSLMLVGGDSLASYTWSTGDTTDTIWTIPGVEENYIVTIRLGQCEKVESIRVSVDDLACPSIDCDLNFGNYITPNADGVNDRFRVTSDCDVYAFDMLIYNRWGQLVHHSKNLNYGWDGYINGQLAQEGTYYFVVQYKDLVVVDADRNQTQGSFTLLH